MLIMVGVPVEADFLQLVVGVIQNGSAGSFINAAALHAYQPVFHHIGDADAIGAAQLIELFHDGNAIHFLAVDGGWNAFSKCRVT